MRRAQADPAAPLMVYVGRLTGQKGVDVILSATPALLGPAPGMPPLLPSAGAGATPIACVHSI